MGTTANTTTRKRATSSKAAQATPCANCAVTTAPTGCLHCQQGGACGNCGWHVCAPIPAPKAQQAPQAAPQAPQQAAPAPTTPQGRTKGRTALLVAVWALVAVCYVLAGAGRLYARLPLLVAKGATRASVALKVYARTL